MRVVIVFESTEEADGEDGTVTLTKSNINTVEDLLFMYGRAAIAAGYTYLGEITANSEDGKSEYTSRF